MSGSSGARTGRSPGTHFEHVGLENLLPQAYETIETSSPEPPEFIARGNRVLVVGFATGRIKATNKTWEDHWHPIVDTLIALLTRSGNGFLICPQRSGDKSPESRFSQFGRGQSKAPHSGAVQVETVLLLLIALLLLLIVLLLLYVSWALTRTVDADSFVLAWIESKANWTKSVCWHEAMINKNASTKVSTPVNIRAGSVTTCH